MTTRGKKPVQWAVPMSLLEPFQAAFQRDWEPVSKAAWVAWLLFYGLFLMHAAFDSDRFLLVDHVNLIVHEAGHLLFGWFGATAGLWGGTLLELLAPLALAVYFAVHRQTTGVVFAAFFFFENFLYISVYMGDARVQSLPLITVGDPEGGGHDWFLIFARLGLLQYDTLLARVVRAAGWLGMLATVCWFAWQGRNPASAFFSASARP
ncbi:MAG: hypothetical protein HY649_09930 [Acidobacteria bacterium]|nr:hypothetical protein [Acidobacteriota bacterium]